MMPCLDEPSPEGAAAPCCADEGEEDNAACEGMIKDRRPSVDGAARTERASVDATVDRSGAAMVCVCVCMC